MGDLGWVPTLLPSLPARQPPSGSRPGLISKSSMHEARIHIFWGLQRVGNHIRTLSSTREELPALENTGLHQLPPLPPHSLCRTQWDLLSSSLAGSTDPAVILGFSTCAYTVPLIPHSPAFRVCTRSALLHMHSRQLYCPLEYMVCGDQSRLLFPNRPWHGPQCWREAWPPLASLSALGSGGTSASCHHPTLFHCPSSRLCGSLTAAPFRLPELSPQRALAGEGQEHGLRPQGQGESPVDSGQDVASVFPTVKQGAVLDLFSPCLAPICHNTTQH